MPIINGQKMACAPCIRGHRSTKCNHFYERVMVPVRKPGRPLSTCPCPPGRPCACGGVRVAIPKKQKCGCPSGTSEDTSAVDPSPSPTETPTSPSRPSFRVSKSSSGSKSSSRKQSFDPANLERMDPRSINLISPPNSVVSNGAPTVNGRGVHRSPPELNGYGPPISMPPPGPGAYMSPPNPNYDAAVAYSMALQYAQAGQIPPVKREDSGPISPQNGSFGPPFSSAAFVHGPSTLAQPPQLSPPLMDTKPNGTATRGSCCGGGESSGVPAQPTQPSPPLLAAKPNGGPPPASCCGGGDSGNSDSAVTSNMSSPQQGYQPAYMSQFQPPLDLKTHELPGHSLPPPFHYPTVYTYPAEYGSWQQPINPTIWQQVASQPGLAMQAPMASAINGSVAEGMNGADAGTSHQCSCGEGCQCVGCLAHPFNAQMFQYVNTAYESTTNGSTNGANGVNGGSPDLRGQVQPPAAPDSPPEAPTPSDASGASEEQSLSGVDYFFVNLPISGFCEGSVVSCPCGDACECVGCLVHNTPVNTE